MLSVKGHYDYVGDFSKGIYQHSHIRTFVGSVRYGMRSGGTIQSISNMISNMTTDVNKQIDVLIKFLKNVEKQYGITAKSFDISPDSIEGIAIKELGEIKERLGKGGENNTKTIANKGDAKVLYELLQKKAQGNFYANTKVAQAISTIIAEEYGQTLTKELVNEIKKTFTLNLKKVKISPKNKKILKGVDIKTFGDLTEYPKLSKKLLKGFVKYSRAAEVQKSYENSIRELNNFAAKFSELSTFDNLSTKAGIENIKKLLPKAKTFKGRSGLYTEISSSIGFLLEPIVAAGLLKNDFVTKESQFKITPNKIQLSTQGEQNLNTTDVQVTLKEIDKKILEIGASIKSNQTVFWKKQTINKNFLNQFQSGIDDVTVNKIFYILTNYRSLKKWNVESIGKERQFKTDSLNSIPITPFTGFYNEVTKNLTYLATIKSLLGIVFLGNNTLKEIEEAMSKTSYVPLILKPGADSYLMSDILSKIKENGTNIALGSLSGSGGVDSLLSNFIGSPAQRWENKIDIIAGSNRAPSLDGYLKPLDRDVPGALGIGDKLKAQNMYKAENLSMSLTVRFNYADLGLKG